MTACRTCCAGSACTWGGSFAKRSGRYFFRSQIRNTPAEPTTAELPPPTPLQAVRAKLEVAGHPKTAHLSDEDLSHLPERDRQRILDAREARARLTNRRLRRPAK